jgi:acetyl-CoA acetyltransferase
VSDPHKRRLTSEQAAELVALVRAGEGVDAAGRHFGIGEGAARLYCWRGGITPAEMRALRRKRRDAARVAARSVRLSRTIPRDAGMELPGRST